QNVGTAAAPGDWVDRVYLSRDTTVSADDRLLGTLRHSGGLAASAVYDASAIFALPIDVSGSWFVLVATDAANTLRELNSGGSNTGAAPIAIALAPYADLEVSQVTPPTLTIQDPARVTV